MTTTTTTKKGTTNMSITRTMAEQIGARNILAISGGRMIVDEAHGEIILPVASGYKVVVTYCRASDTYTVRRVMVRGAKVFEKGTITGVYCDQVGEIAYRASCFRDGSFGEVLA